MKMRFFMLMFEVLDILFVGGGCVSDSWRRLEDRKSSLTESVKEFGDELILGPKGFE